jgi:AraC-like DNA-binding protein
MIAVTKTQERIELESHVLQMTQEGLTVNQMAERIGRDYYFVYRIFRCVCDESGIVPPAKSGRRIPKGTIEQARQMLMTTNLGILEIAHRLELKSRSSIYYLRKKMQTVEERKAGRFQPSKADCCCPVHGALSVWPCVACEAEAFRKSRIQLAGNTR